MQMIRIDGAAQLHRLARHATLVARHANAGETLGKFAVGLFAHQLAREVSPEIHAGDVKEIARGPAEQMNQGRGIGEIDGVGGEAMKKGLEVLIGSARETALRSHDGETTRDVRTRTSNLGIVIVIHKCLNLLGKYLSSQFESRKMGRGCLSVKSRDGSEIPSQPEKRLAVRPE